jgi:SOS response regulatory protein OraA/RecX
VSDAYQDGVRLLARRALTRREVVSRLRERGHDDAEVEAAVTRLVAQAAIDDASLARQWVASHAAARGRGRERALAELQARGIDEAVASSAWSSAVDDGTIDADVVVRRAVRRRLGPPPGRAGRARLARVYNALLHEGFEPQPIEAALAPYGFERIDP